MGNAPAVRRTLVGSLMAEALSEALWQAAEFKLGGLGYRAVTRSLLSILGARGHTWQVGARRTPAFVREGEGTPLVLLHGFGADKEGWLPLLTRLGRTRPLLIPDLPGFGESADIPREEASAAAQARHIRELLDQSTTARAHIVGNSMGAGIALRLAAEAPERVASLTLLGTVGPVFETSEVVRALEQGDNLLLTSTAADYDRLIDLVTRRPPSMPRPLRRYLGQKHAARRESYARTFDGWLFPTEGAGVPHAIEGITCPTLIIHGQEDRVIPVSTAQTLARRLPLGEFMLLPEVGHLPHLEAVSRVGRALERFIRQVEQGQDASPGARLGAR